MSTTTEITIVLPIHLVLAGEVEVNQSEVELWIAVQLGILSAVDLTAAELQAIERVSDHCSLQRSSVDDPHVYHRMTTTKGGS